LAKLERVSFQEYLDHPNYGASDLATFRVGPPAMVPWSRRNRGDGDTAALGLGRVAHCLTLEPHEFDAHYAIKPKDMEFRSNADKAKRDAWLAKGLQIVKEEDCERLARSAMCVREKLERVGVDLSGAIVEHSVFWIDHQSKLPRKCRPDFVVGDISYDLKFGVTAEKTMDLMMRAAANYGWLHQGAQIREGLRACGIDAKVHRLIIASPNPPHADRIWLLEMGEDDLDFLELQNVNTCLQMVEHHEKDWWPGSPDSWRRVSLPASVSVIMDEDLHGAVERDDQDNPLLTDAHR